MKRSVGLPGGWRCGYLVMVACATFQTGCGATSAASYERPAVSTPSVYRAGGEAFEMARESIAPHWWRGFRDTYLDALIERSIQGNPDLRIAVARVEEASAAIGQARAARLPTVSAGGNVTARGDRSPFSGNRQTTENYGAQTQLSWEIDTWGKLKKGVNARKAAYRAGEADWRAAYLTIVSQVATSYFLVRQFDEQLAIQQRSLDTAQSILRIYRNQLREGLVANTEVLRQEAEVNSIRRGVLDLQRQRELGENALATLLGVPAGGLDVPVSPLTPTVRELDVPAGLPADLLRRRPDIVAAEYRVLEAYELVGQAELARLPSLSLTGNSSGGGSLASASLSALVKSLTFGIGPSVNIPLFDPGVKARIRTSKASARTREEEYRRTVILAFQEVEDALVNLSSRRAQKAELLAELKNLETVARQMRAQLRAGIVTQLEVLESERRLLSTNQSLLSTHQQILADTVTLYKAMGGGWDEDIVSQASL